MFCLTELYVLSKTYFSIYFLFIYIHPTFYLPSFLSIYYLFINIYLYRLPSKKKDLSFTTNTASVEQKCYSRNLLKSRENVRDHIERCFYALKMFLLVFLEQFGELVALTQRKTSGRFRGSSGAMAPGPALMIAKRGRTPQKNKGKW